MLLPNRGPAQRTSVNQAVGIPQGAGERQGSKSLDAPPTCGRFCRASVGSAVGTREKNWKGVPSSTTRFASPATGSPSDAKRSCSPHCCCFTFLDSVLESQHARLSMSMRPRLPSLCPFFVPPLPNCDVVSSDTVGLSDVTHFLLEISTDNGGVMVLLPGGQILVVRTGLWNRRPERRFLGRLAGGQFHGPGGGDDGRAMSYSANEVQHNRQHCRGGTVATAVKPVRAGPPDNGAVL